MPLSLAQHLFGVQFWNVRVTLNEIIDQPVSGLLIEDNVLLSQQRGRLASALVQALFALNGRFYPSASSSPSTPELKRLLDYRPNYFFRRLKEALDRVGENVGEMVILGNEVLNIACETLELQNCPPLSVACDSSLACVIAECGLKCM